MKPFIKLLAAFLATVAAALPSARADEKIVFEANANMFVSTGERFPVEFVLNAEPDKGSFAAPSFEGFDVVAGPVESHGRQIQIINGEMSSSVKYTYTYALVPRQAGQFRIGAAEISVKGTTYRTEPTMVEVRERGEEQAGGAAGGRPDGEMSAESAAEGQIGRGDLMLRLSLSRGEVYAGEPVNAKLKLYSRVNVVGSEGAKMPVFNGFWSQQLETRQTPSRETVDGKVYETYDIAEYLLYPQQSGTLEIEPAELTVVVQIAVQSRRGFDPFFGGHEIYHVRRNLSSPRVSLRVKELPAGAPASFTGAVGKFKMDADISAVTLAANSAATIVVRISGNGNLSFIQAPKVEGAGPFEFYDVKSSEQIRNTAAGSTGYRQFEYPFIARAEGEHVIHPVEFSYFDPASENYVTLCSAPFVPTVTPDRSGSMSQGVVSAGTRKEDVRLLGSDIRYIKFGNAGLTRPRKPLIFSALYFAILLGTALLAAALWNYMRKRIRDSRNTALVKRRRANKVAVQRFRLAAGYMNEHNRRAFYEEMLRALWGYMSDRFNIPVSDLTKETVREELARRGAGDEARRVTDIISACEEAQYSPLTGMNMEEAYAEGIDIISRIEAVLKR